MATAGDIVTRVRNLLNDEDSGNYRWTDAELLRWLNDAQRAIVSLSPDANTVIESVSLASGVKQSLPVGGVRLYNVMRNMGTNGSTPGSSVSITEMEDLAAFDPSWSSTTASNVVKNFMIDERSPLSYYVYPPVSTPCYVELMYSKFAADIASTSDAMTLWDAYHTPLVDFICYRAYMKESNVSGSRQKAQEHKSAFVEFFGGKASIDVIESANSAIEGGTTPKSRRQS